MHDFLEFIYHDPETNQLSSVEPLAQVMVAAEQIQRQSAAQHHPKVSHRTMTRAARPRWRSLRKQLLRHLASQQQGAQEMLENAEVTEIKCAVFRAFDVST